MNRILFAALAFLVLSCQQDEIKNTYTIRGFIGWEGTVYLVDHFRVTLVSHDQVIATSTDAEFIFENLEEGRSYTIIPESTEINGNGISTLDWVMVDKYLQGQLVLDPFQKLAADVNKNDVITGEDSQLIRNCILTSYKLLGCFSWRFASSDFDGNTNGYVDHYTVTNLNSDREINFVPIKIGDVNNTIRP